MELTGLVNNIVIATYDIYKGRKYLATDGFERTGRLSYEEGISIALDTFKNALSSADPLTMILVELTLPETRVPVL